MRTDCGDGVDGQASTCGYGAAQFEPGIGA